MSTEGNDPPAGEDAGPDPTPDPAPTESSAPQEPPPPPAAEPSAPPPSSPAASFDFAAVPRSVWISAGGAFVLLISVFFSWYTASVTLLGRSASGSENGWDSGDGGKLVFLLALIILAVWAVDLFADNVTLPFPASMVALGVGALALVVVVIKFFSKPGDGVGSFAGGSFSVSVAWGLYVAILAAIAVVVGAYMHMNETSS